MKLPINMNSWEIAIIVVAPFVLGLILLSAIWKVTSDYLKGARNPPYFTWYMLHLAVGLLGLLVVLILALHHDLSAAATAVVASIVSYGLGAAASHHSRMLRDGPDVGTRLLKLKELRSREVISEEEYAEQRKAVLQDL